jgi:hypothetical protein
LDEDTTGLYALYVRGDRPEDEDEAWLKAAAEGGHIEAMRDFANILESRGQRAEAKRWRALCREAWEMATD